MFPSLKKLFAPSPYQAAAHAAYVALVAESRRPFFYAECAVPDTLDGRFDVIVLHMFLVNHRLRKEDSEEAGEFARVLQEVFFADMDRSVREMGVSDTGVGKRIKNMAQAFFGRLQAYSNGLANSIAFNEALKRNLYREQEISEASLHLLHDYCMRALSVLDAQDAGDLLRGVLRFS